MQLTDCSNAHGLEVRYEPGKVLGKGRSRAMHWNCA
jgi:hypothetical protein